MANWEARDIEYLYKAKDKFHQKLSNLSFERKIEILVKLQEIAFPLRKRKGLSGRIWKL
jgi:hypothetical protein